MFVAYFKTYEDRCLFGYPYNESVEVLAVQYITENRTAFLIRDKSMHIFRRLDANRFYIEPEWRWEQTNT